jgi:SAM-dependent methyltransferase
MTELAKERFQPPPNKPPGKTLAGKVLFAVRSIADVQVASVLRDLKPWLAAKSGSLLEVGCGVQPYRHLVPETCHYTGLDWEQSEAGFSYRHADTVYYTGDTFPFGDASFDSLFHTEVLEHVFDVGRFLRECRRTLKPGGEMFFSVPFQARYHYIPYDYYRYTPAALARLLAEAGFQKVSVVPRGNDICVAAYKNLALSYRWLQGGLPGKIMAMISLPLALFCLAVCHLTLRLKVGSVDDCLGYSVVAQA